MVKFAQILQIFPKTQFDSDLPFRRVFADSFEFL